MSFPETMRETTSAEADPGGVVERICDEVRRRHRFLLTSHARPDGDSIGIRPMGFLPMSWDHRAMDGAEAARFLSNVKLRLEGGEVR